jgi:serine/threonine-protein kinase RsbW
MRVQQRRMSVTGVIENVRSICDFVVDFVNDVKLGDDLAFQFQLSIEEICTNIVEHGYQHKQTDKKIEIVCVYDNSQVTIRIFDEAPLFNPLELDDPDPDIPLWEREGGGWGIYFVKQYMTSVTYEEVSGQNSLLLIKEINS